MSTTTPSRFTMTTTETIPLTWDTTDLLLEGQSISSVSVTMTRITPTPETDATALLTIPVSVDGVYITQIVEGSQLTLNAVYRIDVTFQAAVDTILTIQSFLYVENATPYPTGGFTLQYLRQQVGFMLNECFLCEATATGTESSFVDINNIWVPRGELKNRFIYFYGGTPENIGEMRILTDSDPATGTVQWGINLPYPTVLGDRAEIWSTRAQGLAPTQVNQYLRIAHREASVYNHAPVVLTLTTDFDAYPPNNTVAVPTSVSKVEVLEYLAPDGTWMPIPKAPQTAPGFWISAADRTATINAPYAGYALGSVVRMRGRAREPELTHDSDTTIINAEWLTARAAELGSAALMNRNPDQQMWRDKMYKYERDAKSMRTVIIPRSIPGMVLE